MIPRPAVVAVVAVLVRQAQAGKLRRDLAARLGAAELTLAPLRDHLTDVVQLAPHLLARLAARERLNTLAIGCCAMKRWSSSTGPTTCANWKWRCYTLVVASAEGVQEILLEHLPEAVRGVPGDGAEREPLDEATLRGLLEARNWNVTKVAGMAGVDQRTVQRKMKEYGIQQEA